MPVVNFTNISKAGFSPIFLSQKTIKPNFKYLELLYKKATRKMLGILTPGLKVCCDRATSNYIKCLSKFVAGSC
jgi:hypothetical protein